jgi:cold shock CspA family protein
VAFASGATNLVAGDTNGFDDVFVHDRATGITERVSVDSSGVEGNDYSSNSNRRAISADGQVVAFGSLATNLVAGDTNGTEDVFVHESCEIATWSNYGAGFPGTNGIPAITSQQNPVLGTTITIDVANSYGNPTVGLLFIGFQQTIVPTNKGGDLLVVPALTAPITFSYGGDSFTGDIPDDHTLCGVAVDVQVIEADPGAAKGMSFTAGLELVLGR